MPKKAAAVDTSTFAGQIAAEIRRRRLKKFPRAEDAARAARVPTQTWYKWEQGSVDFPVSALPTIAKALGCKVRQLIPAE